MALNVASLNARELRDALAELSNLGVDVAAVQETHFTCEADCRVLENDCRLFSIRQMPQRWGLSASWTQP